jgi:TfoX/Sxy family transcriptional regulator of competence genes
MASRQTTVDFIMEQIAGAGAVSAKKMFGEYGIYCGGKMVALVCDDQLFVKQTDAGKNYLGECDEAPPYPGAKPCFLIDGERWDDGTWLTALIKLTAAHLPLPPPRKPAKLRAAKPGKADDRG